MARTHQTSDEFLAAITAFESYIHRPVDKILRRRRELQYIAGGNNPKASRPTPTRTAIDGMSEISANRLRRYIDNYYVDFEGMVTLTYGTTWPKDGRVVKRHLNALFEALRRTGWFDEYSLVWWLEFQTRGAPHMHMLVTGWLSKSWLSSTWSRISGAPCETSTRVEQLRDKETAGSYAAKYAAKQEQKTVPPGFERVGRFWGVRGRRPAQGPRVPKVVSAATPAAARTLLRACARAYARARARPGAEGNAYTIGGAVFRTLRIYEHEGGWSCYGSAREIDEFSWLLTSTIQNYEKHRRENDGQQNR